MMSDDEEISPYLHDSDTRWKPGPVALRAKAEEDAMFDRIFPAANRVPAKIARKRKKNKPNKQPKITTKFDLKRSVDGYPLKDCEYEPLEDKLVYRPRGYIDICRCVLRKVHCVDCHLKPCIIRTFGDETREIARDMNREGKSLSQILSSSRLFLCRKICKLFKVRYTKKYVPPSCVMEFLRDIDWVYRDDSSDDESSGSEAEFELGNGKVVPFSIVHNRQEGDPPLDMLADNHMRQIARSVIETKSIAAIAPKVDLMSIDPEAIVAELESIPRVSSDGAGMDSTDDETVNQGGCALAFFDEESSEEEDDVSTGDDVSLSPKILSQNNAKFHNIEDMGVDPSFHKLEVIKGNQSLEFVRVVSTRSGRKMVGKKVNRVSI